MVKTDPSGRTWLIRDVMNRVRRHRDHDVCTCASAQMRMGYGRVVTPVPGVDVVAGPEQVAVDAAGGDLRGVLRMVCSPGSQRLRLAAALAWALRPALVAGMREDELIRLYTTEEAKEDALIKEIIDAHEKGRPILVGTLDVAESERIAKRLGEKGLQSVVLNAKNDAEEAAIVAEAGNLGLTQRGAGSSSPAPGAR